MAENNIKNQNLDEDAMFVTLDLDNGTQIECEILTIFEVNKQDYIALLPLDENGENSDGEVWLYGYRENENDPNEEPELIFIHDDDEYDAVSDAFDEYLDNAEFDELL